VSESCGTVSSSVGLKADRKVGYIRISTFNKKTAELFSQQLNDLRQAGADAFVLDIRNNGGGYFPAGVQVCNYTVYCETCCMRITEQCGTHVLMAGVQCRLRRACYDQEISCLYLIAKVSRMFTVQAA
jgi:hypothetical protein